MYSITTNNSFFRQPYPNNLTIFGCCKCFIIVTYYNRISKKKYTICTTSFLIASSIAIFVLFFKILIATFRLEPESIFNIACQTIPQAPVPISLSILRFSIGIIFVSKTTLEYGSITFYQQLEIERSYAVMYSVFESDQPPTEKTMQCPMNYGNFQVHLLSQPLDQVRVRKLNCALFDIRIQNLLSKLTYIIRKIIHRGVSCCRLMMLIDWCSFVHTDKSNKLLFLSIYIIYIIVLVILANIQSNL